MACLSRFLGGVLICLGASAICLAQFNSGIQGVVTDPSGGTIPDAKVRVVNTATGVAREVITLPDGLYRVLSLGPGSYSVTVEKTGFISARRDAVNLDVNLIVRMDVMLQLAGVTQEVSVRDRPPGVETEQARVSGLVDRAQLSELPINGRNIYNLVALQPGITGRSLLSSADTFATEFGPHANANGQRWEANSYTVDDTSVNAAYRAGNSNLVPSPESVQEVRVVSNNFSATDGRSPGGQVQVITKSGTNAFHGSALYYFRNNNLSSRTVFETAIPVFRKNQFGYSIGGPIVKNRVFFFTAYEGMRQSGGRTRQYTVETQALRDLIVQTRPNSIAAKLLRGFAPVSYPTFNLRDLGSPKPGVNVTGPADGIPDLGSVWYTPREMRDGNQINVRVDVELRPGKDRIYGNFFRNTLTSLTGGVRGAFDKGYDESSPYGNLNHTHTFGPSKLNEFRAGVSRIWGFPFYPASSSSRRELPNPEVPVVSIPSMSGFGISYYPLGWWQTSFQYKDTFTWVLASHTMKMGGELRRMRTSSINTNNYIPTYAFANVLDFADDEALQETRNVDPRTGAPSNNFSKTLVTEWAGFFNDDWKASRKLTFSLGLRYENFGTISQKELRSLVFGSGSNFAQRLASGRVDFVDRYYPPDNLNLAPRFGFAWDPSGKGRLAVRGGYGIAYERVPNLSSTTNPPLRATVSLGLFFGTNFTYSLGDPSKPYLGYPVDPALQRGLDERNGIVGSRVAVMAVDPNLRSPYVHNWFFGVQRELGRGMVVEANYVGSAGHLLLGSINENRYVGDLVDGRFDGFNPSFSAINLTQACCNSVYHGGTVQFRRSFQQGVSVQAALTFGKAISEIDQLIEAGQTMDAGARRLERALADYDVARKLSIVGMWQLPFFRAAQSWPRRLLGGWELTGFAVLESGLPFGVTTSGSWPSGDYNADGVNNDRPNAPVLLRQRGGWSRSDFQKGIFKASDFPKPVPGTNGDLSRSAFRGPGFAQTDVSLSKKFQVVERVSAQLRVDAYNAFNRVNLNLPSRDLTSVSLGQSSGSSIPRMFEVAMRIEF